MSKTGIAVSGVGQVSQQPDILLARLGTEVVASSVESALERCSAHMAKMVKTLRAAGIAAEDMATAGASVRNAYNEGKAQGWAATQTLTVRFRDFDQAGELVSKTLGSAGNAARLHHLAFEADDDSAAKTQARQLAFADARAKAELYAELVGRELGPVSRLVENDTASGAVPMRKMAYSGGRGASMPVEPGSLDIEIRIDVNWDFVGQ